MVEEFGEQARRRRLLRHRAALQAACGTMPTCKTYAMLEERGLPLAFHGGFMWGGDRTMELCNRFIAVHALGFTFYNMVHLTNWVVNGMPERFPEAQGDLDRERARLAAVPDAAPRQRIHDAQLRGAAPEAEAERLYARDVLHDAADGDGRQPQGARSSPSR